MVISALIFTACSGKDNVKPSEDSQITQNVLETLNQIKTAYESRDAESLRNRISSDLVTEILNELSFAEARLNLSNLGYVKIREAVVEVAQNWETEWIVNGKRLSRTGVSKLVFQKDPLKLIQIEGDNPFVLPKNIKN